MESEGLKDDSILVAGAFNAQLFETALISVSFFQKKVDFNKLKQLIMIKNDEISSDSLDSFI